MGKKNKFKLGAASYVKRKTIDIIVDDSKYFTITRNYVKFELGYSDFDLIDFEPTCDELFSIEEKSYIMGLYDAGEFDKWLVD